MSLRAKLMGLVFLFFGGSIIQCIDDVYTGV